MFLGVDGGGTKTEFVLLTAQGRVLARHAETGSYYIQVGMVEVGRIVREGCAAVLRAAGASAQDIRFAFLGLPAHGEDETHTAQLDDLPAAVLPAGRFRCGNDMICGWAGSLGGSDGINVVAGTGSICYGERAGRGARCGGWGELFSDEGSAFWIAREGLAAFSRMSDGRLPRGPLHALLVKQLGLKQDIHLTDLVLNEWKAERDRIAALSLWVKAAADAGDEVARAIFQRAGAELAALVDATRRRLDFGATEAVRISYSGGAFNAGDWLLQPMLAALRAACTRYELCPPRFSPALGAALYAARCAGEPLDAAALDALARSA